MLTGLELMFMGVTQSNSGLFSTPGLLSRLWEKVEGGQKKRREVGKRNRRGKEGRKKE